MKLLLSTVLTIFIFVLFPASANASAIQLSLDMVQSTTTPSDFYWSMDVPEMDGSNSFSYWLYTTVDNKPVGGEQCWPLQSGNGGFVGLFFSTLSTSTSHAGNTNFGAAPCNTSGDYYIVVHNDTDAIEYYGKYYYDAITGIATGEQAFFDDTTRIIDFNPQDGETVNGPSIDFDLEVFVNPNDIGSIKGVTVTMRNIDQNVLLLGVFSPNDIVLLDEYQLSAGFFNYSTTSIPLADGNYRLRVCLDTNYFGLGFGVIGGWISGAFGNVNICESHQFIVGTSTFIGNISQNLWQDTQDFFGNSTATSSEALAATCNPFLSVFGIRECMAFLFVPDNNQLQLTLTEARNAFLTRIPWGYFTRTVDIMSGSASSSLPSFTASIQIGAGSDMNPATTSISFDINDMVAGAGNLVDSIDAIGSGVSFRDVFYPMIQGSIALIVLLTIIADISNTHTHGENQSREKTKTT